MKFSRWILITGTLFIVFALIFNFGIPVLAGVKLDGFISPAEWNGCVEKTMFNNEKESNCAISFAYLRILESPSTKEIFVGLMVTDSKVKENYFSEESPYYGDNSPIAVRIALNGTELNVGIKESDYDKEPYHVTSAFQHITEGYMFEIRIGVKLDFPLINHYDIRLVDSSGEPSTRYSISIDNTPTTVNIPEKVINTAKPTTTKKPSTTKLTTKTTASRKTTSQTTTRRWTTDNKTKTTVPKTTKSSTTAAIIETSVKASKKTAKAKETNAGNTTEITEYTTQLESITQTETQYIIVSAESKNDDSGQMKKSHKIVLSACVLAFIAFGLYGYFLQKKKKSE